MLRSMFTAISALNAHQTWMDVIGNNLANVNTTGYKTSFVRFQDQISQLLRPGSSPTGTRGGVDPMQVGLGMRVGSITQNFTQGALTSTGRMGDLALQGDGFFNYRDGAGTLFYSRDGSIDLDADGYMVNTNTGYRIQGWLPTGTPPVVNTGTALTDIRIPINSTLARQTSSLTMRGNLNALQPMATPVTVTFGAYDAFGALHNVDVQVTRTGANAWSWTTVTGGTGSGTLTFNPATGALSAGGTGTINVPASASGAQAFSFTVDLTSLTQLETDNSAYAAFQDGVAAGTVTGYTVETKTGQVYAQYSNGLQNLVAQLAVTSFVNPAGLNKVGQNLYQQGVNAGEPNTGLPDSNGRGAIIPGSVEASNVDLSQEFTNMILAQRGFQASSRVITTSDEMLQELVNLKR
ncbi:MAG: flagellar hook protein FlgE [Anaerolineales bacterium]|nr:flagellar hook protein FlgE [Anaerolineales bacterium]